MGRTEYDLIKELGRGNWIDEVAGEAVLLGFSLVDPLLEARGAELAAMVREIGYDSDHFYLVQSFAHDLQKQIEAVRSNRERFFLDCAGYDEKYKWPDRDWKFTLMYLEGRYQIEISLPVFNTDNELYAVRNIEAEVCGTYPMDFDHYRCEKEEDVLGFACQKFTTIRYFGENDTLIRRIIIHQHEEDCTRGFKEDFFFDSFGQATDAWVALKELVTSGRK